MSEFAKEFFMIDEIREKVIFNFNYTLESLNGKEAYKKFKIK